MHAPYRYAAPLDRLIPALKFGGKLAHARLLGELLAEELAASGARRPELILPVPLHARRLRERGYNQALELARPVARALGLPLETRACTRLRATAAQSGLDLKARRANLRGAFAVPALGVKHVAVLDDVVTSGSTVAELARALARAGVERVDVWAVARATRE
jgi:ComF family protein